MSADRSVAVGEWGCSKIRCNGHIHGRDCRATVTGAFRRGIDSARREAERQGWQVAVRTQYAPNGSDLREYRVNGAPGHDVYTDLADALEVAERYSDRNVEIEVRLVTDWSTYGF